jgi:hypothetical protein
MADVDVDVEASSPPPSARHSTVVKEPDRTA